jgi:phytoene synthase
MIAAREVEADPEIASRAAFLEYLDGTAGGLAVAAGRLLGGADDVLARLRRLGSAYGLAGQLRNVGALARQGRCLLPADVLGAHGLTIDMVIAGDMAIAGDASAGLHAALGDLAGDGMRMLRQAGGRLPREVLAAGLPGVFARRDLRRPGVQRARSFGDRMAVTMAALSGRV